MKAFAALVACLTVAVVVVASPLAEVTSLTLSLDESSPYSYVSGSTLYYAPTSSNNGSFTVTATAKADTPVHSVAFPALFGTDETEDGDSPYSQTYSWTASSLDSGAKTVKATEAVTDKTKSATFTVTPDKTGPTGQTVGLSGGPGYSTLSVPLLLADGSDAGAGIESSSGIVERASATFSATACGTFGSYAAITLSDGADTSVVTGNCYRYQYTIADRVGNVSSASAASGEAKVDATPPTTPALSFAGLTSTAASGSVVYVRPGGSGSFTVTATSTDSESGVASYSFPALAGFTQVGAGPSRTYSFSGAQGTAAGPLEVAAVNGTGLASAAASFTLAPDSTSPTVTIGCNGEPCRTAAYPKNVTVTLAATDTGGSGVGTLRYTFDGTLPTASHGAEYEGPFVVNRLTRMRVCAFDRVGNASRILSATIRSLADRLVFVAPARVSLKPGARYLSARVTSSHRGIASATLAGPGLKKPRRWRFVVGAGTSIVQLRLPKLSRTGRYTLVWIVQTGTRKTSTTTRVVLRPGG